MHKQFIVLLFFIVLGVPKIIYAHDVYHFEQYSRAHGLSDDYISGVTQDAYGCIWVATSFGLNKFDGNIFTNFVREQTRYASLLRNDFRFVYADTIGNIWIGGDNGTIQNYNYELDIFQNVSLNYVSMYEYPGFYGMYQKSGTQLYAFSDYGLYRYSKYSGKFHKAFREFPQIAMQQVSSMYIDSHQNTWLATSEAGLFFISSDSNKIRQHVVKSKNQKQAARILQILAIDTNTLLLATSVGVYQVQYNSQGLLSMHEVMPELSGVYISSLLEDNDGNVWIGTSYKGLWVYNLHNKHLEKIFTKENVHSAITSVTCLFMDSGSRIWIGTLGNGLYCMNPAKQNIHTISSKNGLRHDVVSAIIKDDAGNIWIGTDGGGISIFSPSYALIRHIHSENGLPSDAVLSFAKSPNMIWAAMWRGGVVGISTKDFSIVHYSTSNSKLLYDGIKSISWYNDTLILGTHRAGVQFLYTKEKRVSEQSGFLYNYFNPTEHSYVNQVLRDSRGQIWVATIRNLYCVAPDNKAQEVLCNDSHEYPQNPLYIYSIVFDSIGFVLACTNKGLFKINIHSFEILDVTEIIPELQNAHIFSLCNVHNKYWITSSNGLYVYNTINHERKYIPISPIANRLFYTPRAIFSNGNSMYIGTNHGMVWFPIRDVENFTSKKALYFSDLFFSYERIVPGSNHLVKSLHLLDSIAIPYDYRNWGVSFHSVCFDAHQSIVYAYMLEGFDKEWHDIGTKQEITFINIPPGKYILKIKAVQQANNSEVYTQLFVTIPSPWWKHIEVQIGMLLCVLLLLWGIYKYRVYKLRAEKVRLHAQIQEATKSIHRQKEYIEEQNNELRFVSEKLEESNDILKHQNEDLEAMTKQLQEDSQELIELNNSLKEMNETKSLIFSIISNDILHSLESLQVLTIKVQTNYDFLSKTAKANTISSISMGLENLQEMLESIILWGKNQINCIEVSPKYCYVDDLMKELIESLQHISFQKKISIHYEKKADLRVYVDKQMILTSLRKVMYQALQKTPTGGYILCAAHSKDHMVEMQIRDSEPGIITDILPMFMSIDRKDFTSKNTKELAQDIGFLVCYEFIQKNRGTFTVETDDEKWGSYKIQLPQDPAIIHVPQETVSSVGEKKLHTIAIVDDNSAIVRLLHEFLQKEYNTLLYSSSQEFLDQVSIHKPDVLISDVFMPHIDGITLCRKIKQNSQLHHISVILISSQHTDSIKQQAYESGADRFLEKPISKYVLLAVLQKIFTLQRNTAALVTTSLPSIELETVAEYPFLMKFEEIVRTNISNHQISIDDIAKELHVSRTHLFRKIKQECGMSPKDYMIKMRMEAALNLLQYYDYKILDVAFATGFSDASYFGKCFVKFYGVTPSEYKESLFRK